eukprot:UN10776
MMEGRNVVTLVIMLGCIIALSDARTTVLMNGSSKLEICICPKYGNVFCCVDSTDPCFHR